ncbi:uncharacterized protein [Rutidosis leptorrhynchoides]|uniref:uncharacterized protein n=1 Tax=Rutidosis leptorrhynchoides TaxID=125765 RepID=UPI003A99D185
MVVYMVNVYAPQNVQDKLVLWNKISDFMANNVGDYILFGDWNAVRLANDRSGTEYCATDAFNFNNFINNNVLHEVPLGGLKFTWRTKAGNKLSKLDRFFVTNNVLMCVDHLKGVVLPRGFSDHSPILLFQEKVDYGPTYFKVFDSWFERAGFDDTVRKEWAEINANNGQHVTKKLRLLKSKLKDWISQSRKIESVRLKEVVEKLNGLDVLIDVGWATESQVNDRNVLFQEREVLSKLESLDLLQKSRLKWDVEGDENSKFFHCSVKHKRK